MGFLALLVRLFPAAFRRQFGREMVAEIREEYAAARAAGWLHAAGFGIGTAADLVGAALAERWRPTWVEAPASSRRKGLLSMNGVMADVRRAVRALRRSPGFTAITVGTLGLAIGATAGIFSVVDGVLLDPLPYASSDRLVSITATAPGTDLPEEFGVAVEFYVQYRESPLLENVTIFNDFTATLRADDRAERVRMSTPTPSLFATLGGVPLLGRLPEEDERDVMVISHALWSTWFGRDPEILGRSLFTSLGNRTVIGVMGPEFRFPRDDIMVWIPMPVQAEGITPGRFGARMVARLAPGVTEAALVSELTTLARRLPERFGGSANYARVIEQHRPVVRSLREALLGDVSRPLWVLLGSVAIVLLIACANVANLFLVRAERRQRDLAIRRAIGAARVRLFRAEITEAVLVALLAGAVAIAIAWATVPPFLQAAPSDIPRLGDVGMRGTTLLFTLVVALLTAVLCGLVPALRSSAPNLDRLRDGSRGSTSRRHWGRDGLVVAQTALALVLLIGSGLLVRSFRELRAVDPGYDTADLFTFQIAPEDNLPDARAFARFHMDFMDRLRALPGVESVGIVENVPLNESTAGARFITPEMAGDVDAGRLLRFTFAAGDYFRTMGIAVRAGRPFETADHTTSPGNVVISESAARMLWPGENPIGRRLQRSGLDTWETVVGVVEDVLQNGFREPPEPVVYFPLVGQNPDSWVLSSPAYVVKTPRAEQIAPEIRALVREVAPEAPMYRIYTMAGLAADSMVQLSFTMLTLGVTSLLALILGIVGLYGVLSYVVAQRTREIGVRMALGAKTGEVRRMVVVQGARVVVLGVAIGIAVAVAATPALNSLLFEVGAADVATFVAMSITMILVGLLASYLPARRASAVDPLTSLRE